MDIEKSSSSPTSMNIIIILVASIFSIGLGITIGLLLKRQKPTIKKICPPGYIGESCKIECRNGSSTTTNIPGKGRCQCTKGYAGLKCEIACSGNSSVKIDSEGIYRCDCPKDGNWTEDCSTCVEGYYGLNCDRVKFPQALELMLERIVGILLDGYNPDTKEQVLNYVMKQEADGSWKDCIYGNVGNSTYTNNYPLTRLMQISLALVNVSSPYYLDSKFKIAVANGLEYWLDSKPAHANWWFNDIGYPTNTAKILMLLTSIPAYFKPDLWTKAIEALKITELNGSSYDIDYITILTYRTILSNSHVYIYNLLKARDVFYNGLSNMFFADNNYKNAQLTLNSSGLDFVANMITLLALYQNTPLEFSLSDENIQRLLMLMDYQIMTIRYNQADFATLNRAVARKNGLKTLMSFLLVMVSLDKNNALKYTSAYLRQKGEKPPSFDVKDANEYLWNSDYMIHSRKNFLFTSRCVSKRTAETQTDGIENIKANYFSYGSTYISVDGKEYMNIQPIWDWCKIPGTTYPYTTSFPARAPYSNIYGTTDFVGGISNGQFGVSTLNMGQNGMSGIKSWFFFDEEVVCLGAGITHSANNNPVYTTINQEFLNSGGYCTYREYGNMQLENRSLYDQTKVYSNNNLICLHHNNVGYIFPNVNSPIKYTLKRQTGAWTTINSSYPAENSQGDVFALWVDHGVKPTKTTYAYIVVPGVDSLTASKVDTVTSDLEILSNTDSIQAVLSCSNSCLQIVFNRGRTLILNSKLGLESITVSEPCIMMMVAPGSFYISDPTQLLTKINVKITATNGTVLIDDAINLPQKVGAFDYRGSTVTI